MSAPRLSRPTRVAAWVVTGPLGHLYGGIADWLEVAGKLTLAHVRARARGTSESDSSAG